MAGVKVQAQGGTIIQRFQQALGAVIVKGDLRGMHLQRQLHTAFIIDIKDGRPQLLDLLETGLHHFRRGLREGIPHRPDGRAQEAGDHLDIEELCRIGDVLHFLDSPGTDGLRIALAVRGGKVVQAGIPVIAHALADQVRRNRADVHVVLVQGFVDLITIGCVGQHAADIQMRLRSNFNAVVADFVHGFAQFLQGKIAKLAGADIDGALHCFSSFDFSCYLRSACAEKCH